VQYLLRNAERLANIADRVTHAATRQRRIETEEVTRD
jgi:hypothetical protein